MEKEKNIEAQSALTPPLKSIVVNGKKKVAVNGVVNLNLNNLKGGVQPDWDQNDASKPDYIKNRICYDESTTLYDSEILPRMVYHVSGSFYTDSDVDLSKSYTLTVNGAVFPLKIELDTEGDFETFSFVDKLQSFEIVCAPTMIYLNVIDTDEATLLLSSTDGDVLFSDTVQLTTTYGTCILEDGINFIEGESYSITIDDNTFESVAVSNQGQMFVRIQSTIGIFALVTVTDGVTSVTQYMVLAGDYVNRTYPLKVQHSDVHPIADKYMPQLGGVQFKVDDGDLRVSLDGGVSWKFVEVYDK